MQKLVGQREGTIKYFHDGYFYHSDPRYTPHFNYYICTYRYRQWQCPVTARENINGVISVNGEHGHSRSCIREYFRFEEFKNKLKQQARESVAPPNTILETLRIEYSDVAHLIQKNSAKMHIIRERNKYRPSLPENLKDLGIQLVRYDSAQEIYQGQVVISETSSAVIFASDAMLQRLNDCEEIYVDGTFKCVPKSIGAKQLFIVHMRKMNVGMACVYVLCSDRTAELYGGIWKFFLERVPGFKTNLKFIIMDFERALIKSVRIFMPWVTIRGCWFHYTRAISTHWQDLGLKNVLSPLVRDILALAWVLPLLPAEKFSVAIEFFRRKTEQVETEYKESVHQFIDYLEKQWLRIAEIVSLWRSSVRTNNICESFHGRLPQRLGCHPNLYEFIEKLSRVIAEIESNWQTLERDGNSIGNKYLKQANIDSYLNYQQRLFSNGKLDVCEFLMKIKTKNIKNFIEFNMHSPHNVKKFGPEEIASPEELIKLLEYPQSMRTINHVAAEVPKVMQKISIIPEEKTNMSEIGGKVKEPVVKQKKPVGSSHFPTVILRRVMKKKLRGRPTTKPVKFRCSTDRSLEAATKTIKRDKRPRDLLVMDPEPFYKLAPFLKAALQRAEKMEELHSRPVVEEEPRYKLSPSFKALLKREEEIKASHS